jgi:hypothetical protein
MIFINCAWLVTGRSRANKETWVKSSIGPRLLLTGLVQNNVTFTPQCREHFDDLPSANSSAEAPHNDDLRSDWVYVKSLIHPIYWCSVGVQRQAPGRRSRELLGVKVIIAVRQRHNRAVPVPKDRFVNRGNTDLRHVG